MSCDDLPLAQTCKGVAWPRQIPAGLVQTHGGFVSTRETSGRGKSGFVAWQQRKSFDVTLYRASERDRLRSVLESSFRHISQTCSGNSYFKALIPLVFIDDGNAAASARCKSQDDNSRHGNKKPADTRQRAFEFSMMVNSGKCNSSDCPA